MTYTPFFKIRGSIFQTLYLFEKAKQNKTIRNKKLNFRSISYNAQRVSPGKNLPETSRRGKEDTWNGS